MLRFLFRIFESTFVFTFTWVVFLESYFYFLLKYFVLQNTFTFTQVVLRAITFTFTQVLKKLLVSTMSILATQQLCAKTIHSDVHHCL